MSWSASLQEPGSLDDIEALEPSPVTGSEQVQEEIDEQVKAAKAAAHLVIESGALGEAPYTCHLSGHANPDHKPHEHYANDMVSVSLTQAEKAGES